MLDITGFIAAVIIAAVGYLYASKKQLHRTFDGYTLKKLEEAGIDIGEQQALEFWFYGNDRQAVEQLAQQLEQCDYETSVSETDDDPRYIIRAFRTMIPELSAMLALRKEFSRLAKSYRAVYEGWGCAIVSGHSTNNP